jgi:hypothetical protein
MLEKMKKVERILWYEHQGFFRLHKSKCIKNDHTENENRIGLVISSAIIPVRKNSLHLKIKFIGLIIITERKEGNQLFLVTANIFLLYLAI